jgi:integrase
MSRVDLRHPARLARRAPGGPLTARAGGCGGPSGAAGAALLKDLGVPPRDTMEILGHARIAVTMEIYTGADDASRRAALTKLSALFGIDPD